MEKALLELEDITVSFDGFKALNSLSSQIPSGGIKVFIGPNGSGKSTLLDTVIGKVRPESGRVIYNGVDITHMPAHRIAHMGIRCKFQTPGILGKLTVYENLAVAARGHKGVFRNFGRGLNATERERVEEVLDIIDMTDRRDLIAGELSHGEQQWLEIGMVVSSEPDLLLLDEPTAGMTANESWQTAQLIRRLASQHTVLVIDHDMTFVEQLDASISVLHMGQVLKEGNMEAVRNDPEVVSVYLGHPMVETNA